MSWCRLRSGKIFATNFLSIRPLTLDYIRVAEGEFGSIEQRLTRRNEQRS